MPFSLALRLVRIVSNKDRLVTRMEELEAMLVSRQYKKNIIKAAIAKALAISRLEALKKVVKTKHTRVMFAVTFNPKLPSISNIIGKHWRTMIRDTKLKKLLENPPLSTILRLNN